MIGFLTPGAPSGIGIREALLVYFLGPELGAAQAIVIAALFRVATISGDLLFWAVCGLRGRRKPVH